jgi:ATP-binding cassette, subfamily C, bacterial CydD
VATPVAASSERKPLQQLDLRLLRSDPRALTFLALAISGGLLGAAAVIGQAVLLSRLLAEVFLRHQAPPGIATTLAALLGLALARGLGLLLTETMGQRAAGRVKAALRRGIASRLLAAGPLHMRSERTGEVASTLGEGVDSLDGYLGQALPQLALAVFVPALVLAVFLAVDPLTALAVLVIAPFIPVLTTLIGLKTKEMMDRRWAQLAQMSAHFLDMLQGLPTLKLFGQSQAQAAGIEQIGERYGRSTMDVLRVAFQSSLVLDLAATMGVALVAIEVGTRLLLRSLPFERAIFLLLLAPEFFLPLRLLGLARHARLAGRSAAERIFGFLDSPARLPPPGGEGWGRGTDRSFEVRIESVSYTPAGREEPALRQASLCLAGGLITALRGPSGAGKTTLANLLLRFAAPDSGSIEIDGQPLNEIEPAQWRRQVAWVPQLPHLFHGSVADNIRLGRPEATRQEVETAARAARADDFIRALPLAYETPLGERGARLSGGQRQRLALARAFLLNRPVVILDEPTVHLDRGTAAEVRESILAYCRGRTTLLITHDPELVALADRVVVLEHGRTPASRVSL